MKDTMKMPDMSNIINKEQEEENEKSQPEEIETYGEKPFTFDELKNHWDTFAESRKKEGKDTVYAVLSKEIHIEGETKVIIALTNAVEINIFDRFRSDLVTYLKKKLDNRHLVVETSLITEDVKKMIYTNKEKFEHLVEKKPTLKMLQDRLGLDPDF